MVGGGTSGCQEVDSPSKRGNAGQGVILDALNMSENSSARRLRLIPSTGWCDLLVLFVILSSFFFSPFGLRAQVPAGTLRGRVLDPSGASVPEASVQAVSSSGKSVSAQVKADGSYDRVIARYGSND